MESSGYIEFGVGWGLPYAWAAVWSILTIFIVKMQLKKEEDAWRAKEASSVASDAWYEMN